MMFSRLTSIKMITNQIINSNKLNDLLQNSFSFLNPFLFSLRHKTSTVNYFEIVVLVSCA